jgi:hypothetical protein
MDQGSPSNTAFARELKESLEIFLETRMAAFEATLHSSMDRLLWDPDLFERNLDQGLGEEGQALRLYQGIGSSQRVTTTLKSAVHIAVEEAAFALPRALLFQTRRRVEGPELLREVEAWFIPLLSLLIQKLAGLLDEGRRFDVLLLEDAKGARLELGLEGLHPDTLQAALVSGEETLLPLVASMLGILPENIPTEVGDSLCLNIDLPASVYVLD